MSKFHVGDQVRIYLPADEETEVFHNKTGIVSAVRWPDRPGETYLVDIDGYPDTAFTENELRPAEIVPLFDLPKVKTGDTVHLMKRTRNEKPEVGDKVEIHSYIVGEAIDSVNYPAHYNRFPVEVIEFTEQLDFNKGNAVKYLARAGYKEGVDELEDLSKAAWYVNRAIEKLKKERTNEES